MGIPYSQVLMMQSGNLSWEKKTKHYVSHMQAKTEANFCCKYDVWNILGEK